MAREDENNKQVSSRIENAVEQLKKKRCTKSSKGQPHSGQNQLAGVLIQGSLFATTSTKTVRVRKPRITKADFLEESGQGPPGVPCTQYTDVCNGPLHQCCAYYVLGRYCQPNVPEL